MVPPQRDFLFYQVSHRKCIGSLAFFNLHQWLAWGYLSLFHLFICGWLQTRKIDQISSGCISVPRRPQQPGPIVQQLELASQHQKCAALCFSLSRLPLLNQYDLNGPPIDSSESCKDLGIVVNSNLNWSNHYNIICCKAYRSLNLIKRIISPFSPVGWKKKLYISVVRSQVSYCSQLWRPQFVRDIMSLETVQRRSTKYIPQDYSSNYKQRLMSLKLLPLMYWYELQDMLLIIKCIKTPTDNFDIYKYVSIGTKSTRSASHHKLKQNLCRTSCYSHFYFNRIVKLWNAFPEFDISLSIAAIKSFLATHLWNHFITHFNSEILCTYHFCLPMQQLLHVKCSLLNFVINWMLFSLIHVFFFHLFSTFSSNKLNSYTSSWC